MSNRLYVGNLPYSADRESLSKLFAEHGSVTDVHVASDRETGRSRGFGFVSFETGEEAKAAAAALNGHSLDGRALVVNVARERGSGPPPGARREAGPRGPAPRAVGGHAPPMPVEDEEPRRIRERSPRPKKKPQRERDRGQRLRVFDDDESRGGRNWREWLDDEDADQAETRDDAGESAEPAETSEPGESGETSDSGDSGASRDEG
ncbi:MAG: RNA-binding protein [Acidobacteriota bacterium]|nr:RNA-binding protein [Acidobacteriota bacterium]